MDVMWSSRATKMTPLAISEMGLSVYPGSLKIRTILASILPPCTGQVYAREPCGLMLHVFLGEMGTAGGEHCLLSECSGDPWASWGGYVLNSYVLKPFPEPHRLISSYTWSVYYSIRQESLSWQLSILQTSEFPLLLPTWHRVTSFS